MRPFMPKMAPACHQLCQASEMGWIVWRKIFLTMKMTAHETKSNVPDNNFVDNMDFEDLGRKSTMLSSPSFKSLNDLFATSGSGLWVLFVHVLLESESIYAILLRLTRAIDKERCHGD
jgi:hypothetical protein